MNNMMTNKYFSFIEELKNNFDDKMPSLEILKEKINKGREILDLSEIRPDVYQYVLGIKNVYVIINIHLQLGHTSVKKMRLCWLVKMTGLDKSQIMR